MQLYRRHYIQYKCIAFSALKKCKMFELTTITISDTIYTSNKFIINEIQLVERRTKMSMRKIYRKVARQNGVTIKEVRAEMQNAINAAWNDPQNNGIIRAYQNQVPHCGAVPTPDEVIRYTAGRMRG